MSTKIIPIKQERDYYCSNKFTFLKIDFEKQNTYNCHAAAPHSIDFNWLEQNPGQLFNTPINVAERQQMLSNQRNQSCEQNCYPAEDRGHVSTRMIESTPDRRYTNIITQPTKVDFTLFSECNLTCSYCCKEYSSAWRNDLLKNGPYELPLHEDKNRLQLLPIDIVASKVSQQEKINSNKIKLLLDNFYQIQNNVETLTITGGEPFLNNHLLELLEKVQNVPRVNLFTGFGVELKRFKRILEQIKAYKNVVLNISAESTGKIFEFNRFGMEWNDFLEKLKIIQTYNIQFEFHSTLSNLTVLGFADFYKQFSQHAIHIDFVNRPNFMSIGNLDPDSKNWILGELAEYKSNHMIQQIIQTIQSTYTSNDHRLSMQSWITQFAQRRNLDVNIYPKTFLDWLQL
jgi:organic radical activating enzyme